MRFIAIALALLAAGAAPPRPALPFVVGVWADPDSVIPFADFDGHRWRSSWPAPTDPAPEPMPVRQIPGSWWGRSAFQTTWEVIELDGARRHIRVTGTTPARLGSGCSGNLALTTDAPAGRYSYATVVAASRPGAIDPVQTLTSNTTDWRTITSLLPAIYKRYEAAAWQQVPDDWRPNMAAPVSGPRLGGAFIFKDEGSEFAYFESSRRFAPRRDQSEVLHSFITGWLWRASSRSSFQLVTVQPAASDDDGKGTPSFFPLGVVRQGSRQFWLGSSSSYADLSMDVVDVRRAAVTTVLSVDYPGC